MLGWWYGMYGMVCLFFTYSSKGIWSVALFKSMPWLKLAIKASIEASETQGPSPPATFCWGFHVSHTDPRRQGPHSLFRPVRKDLHQWKYGDGCISHSIPLWRHLKFLYDVTILLCITKDLVTIICLCASSQREVGRPERKPSFVPPWLINNNTSSTGKPIILPSIYAHSIRLTSSNA